jgi:hypothetical protein
MRQGVELWHFLNAVKDWPLVRVHRDRVAGRCSHQCSKVARLLGVNPLKIPQGRGDPPPEGKDLGAVEEVAEQKVALLREPLLHEACAGGRGEQVIGAPEPPKPGERVARGTRHQAPPGAVQQPAFFSRVLRPPRYDSAQCFRRRPMPCRHMASLFRPPLRAWAFFEGWAFLEGQARSSTPLSASRVRA